MNKILFSNIFFDLRSDRSLIAQSTIVFGDRRVECSPKFASKSAEFKDIDHSNYPWCLQRDKVHHVEAITQIHKYLENSMHIFNLNPASR